VGGLVAGRGMVNGGGLLFRVRCDWAESEKVEKKKRMSKTKHLNPLLSNLSLAETI